MRWFFYGTLMDADLREIVLDRVVDPRGFVEGYVRGFRRVAVRNEEFPALVRAPGECVAGVVGMLEADQDEARLRFYEGEGYEVISTAATTIEGVVLPVRTFIADRALDVVDRPWEPQLWRAGLAREASIATARKWMEGYAPKEAASAFGGVGVAG